MANGQRVDPYLNFRFVVEIDGIIGAAFREVSGIDSSIEVHEFREGGDDLNSRKLPMRAKYTNIILKFGLTDNNHLYDWHWQALNGNVQRKNGSIIVRDRQGNDKVRWNFFAAWPAKYDGASLNAEGNDVAIETLELAHERLERVK